MPTSTETGGRKVPNILQDERIYRQPRGDPAGLPERRGPQPFTKTGGEVPINVRKRFGILLPRGWRGYFPRLRRQVRLSVEASAQGSRLLFDFGKERRETPTLGVSIFGQPGLEQTQKTKSVVHLQRRVTPRALVQLMRDRWVQISEAIEYHLEGKSQRRGVIFISPAPHWPPAHRRGGGVHRQCQQDSPLFGPLHRATTSGNAAACDTVTFSPYFREPPTS